VTRLQAIVGVDVAAVVVIRAVVEVVYIYMYDHGDYQNDIAKSDTNVEEEVHAIQRVELVRL
jgi:hypothetical protein